MQSSNKKRRTGEANPSHRGRSRNGSSYSNLRTDTAASRGSTVSRRSSRGSHIGGTQRRAPPRKQSARSMASAATSVQLQGDAMDDGRSIATAEQRDEVLSLDLESLDEVVMAVSVAERGSVGCCYYVARDEKLHFMEDVQLGGPETVDAREWGSYIVTGNADSALVKLLADPTVILVSAKCSDEVMNRLDPELRHQRPTPDGDGQSDQTRLPYLLECRPNAEFGYDSARSKLVNLNIGQQHGPSVHYITPGDVVPYDKLNTGDVDGVGRQGALLRLSGWISWDSRLTVGCAGCVLSYLQRRRATSYLPGDRNAGDFFRVSSIEMFSLSESMFINNDTLLSLQITTTESHPNAQQQGPVKSGSSKEGLSVYGLFHPLAKTQQGRRLLKKMFLQPSLNLEVINERHDTIAVFLRPDNSDILGQLASALAGVRDMRIAVINLHKGISSGGSQSRPIATSMWSTLRRFVFSALQICDILNDTQCAEGLLIRHKVVEKFDKRALAEIGSMIGEIVDFVASEDARRTVVLPGVDAELDDRKQVYEGIEDMLSRVAAEIASQVPENIRELNVIFFPQIGFLVSVGHDEDAVPTPYTGPEDDPWEKMFNSESCAYYKNMHTSALDNEFGDIYSNILDMEIEIVQNLGQRVLEFEELIVTTSDICGELDSLVALARGAAQYNLTRPHMTVENVLKITEGRHILQELTVPSFVPNDTHLRGGAGGDTIEGSIHGDRGATRSTHPDAPSMIIMTGPNYSGKSVYLKQVAIIVYMAHIGSFIPASRATIGLTDKILTRISTRESVSRTQSAFMIDLQQTCIALNLATRNSLLVIDEFGKGTESYDGAGLAAGVFEHLLRRGPDCPKVLGATHFHEIFESGFLQARPSLGFAHMEVAVDASVSAREEQITYLYNYRPGRSSSSFGTVCAAMNGIDTRIIERAEEFLALAAQGQDLVEACAELPEAELVELQEAVGDRQKYKCVHWLTLFKEYIARQFLGVDTFEKPRRLLDDLSTEPITREQTIVEE